MIDTVTEMIAVAILITDMINKTAMSKEMIARDKNVDITSNTAQSREYHGCLS